MSHPYRNAQCGKMAANLFKNWRVQNYEPMIIQCQHLDAQARTVALKIHEGLSWLCENVENPEHRAYWQDIKDKVKISRKDPTLHISYKFAVEDLVSTTAGEIRMNARADFQAWSTSLRRIGDRWPAKKIGIKLMPEDVSWFKNRLEELAPKGFFGIVDEDTLRFVYMPNTPGLIVNQPSNTTQNEQDQKPTD